MSVTPCFRHQAIVTLVPRSNNSTDGITNTLKRHRWMPELKEWVKVPKKKQKKKKKPSAPKKEEHKPTDDKGTEQVIVYEEVIVEV